jgi:phospholipid N-methyltransferase
MNKRCQKVVTRGSFLLSAAVTIVAAAALVKGATLFWGQDAGSFFRGIMRNPKQVGAFTPCSVFVSQEITKWVAREVQTRNNNHLQARSSEQTQALYEHSSMLRVLEVGGGSGIFTNHLVKHLELLHDHEYQLDVLEIDSHYCDILNKRFAKYPHVHVYCVDATTWAPSYKYDYIISSLPFINMPVEVAHAMLTKYKKISTPGGIVSYVQLMLANQRGTFLRGIEKEEFQKKVALLEGFNQEFEFERASVWLNITPAYVYHAHITA